MPECIILLQGERQYAADISISEKKIGAYFVGDRQPKGTKLVKDWGSRQK